MNLARALLLSAAVLVGGCSLPANPTVTPLAVRVTSITRAAITIDAQLEVRNPNDYDIEIRSLTAKVVLDEKYDIGTVTRPQAIKLPAKKGTTFSVPIVVEWRDSAALVAVALSGQDVPFVAEGTLKASAKSFEREVPFKLIGVITHQQVVQAVERVISQ